MKKTISLLALLTVIFTCAHAQSGNNHDLVLYMPQVDKVKTLQIVLDITNNTKDVQAVAFCEDLKCLLLSITGNQREKEERMMQELKNAGIRFTIKTDASIARVLNESKQIINEKTNWQ